MCDTGRQFFFNTVHSGDNIKSIYSEVCFIVQTYTFQVDKVPVLL